MEVLEGLHLTVRKLALVCGRVGTDFGLNKGTNYLSIIIGEPLKPAYSANLLLAAGFIFSI